MMASMGAVSQGTPVVTIVHDCQVLPVANRATPCSSERVRGTRGGRGRWGEAGRGRPVSAFTPRCVMSGVAQPRPHPSGSGRWSLHCPVPRALQRVPVSSLTPFCLPRSSTYLKRSLRITTSPWTIFSLQPESSPRGVSAQSQQESRGLRWVSVWHRGQLQPPAAGARPSLEASLFPWVLHLGGSCPQACSGIR